MAIKLVHIEYCECLESYKREYIVDLDADFANLPKCCVGSTAMSPSGKFMIVNASGEWVPFMETVQE